MENEKIEAPAKISSRHLAAGPKEDGLTPWAVKGELILNCNCTIFCPCVVSLGKHAPTEGYCQAWAGVLGSCKSTGTYSTTKCINFSIC